MLKIGALPTNHTWLQVSVKARDESEAYNVAIDKIDLMRGIWSLRLSKEVFFSFSNAGKKPINEITLGGLHTLHFTDGKPTENLFWYEADYVENNKDIGRDWNGIWQFDNKARKYLAKHLYRTDMEDAIKRYVRALDYRDLHISFLELWILLEKLTATKNAEYEKMVRRVAFLYEKVDLHKQVIQHLRLYRNSNVHTGQRSERISKYVYQLKRYIERLIRFHMDNPFKFTNLEEAASFLDLSTDSNALKKRIELLNKGVRFREGYYKRKGK